MRIVSWNILQGGGKRADGIADAIREWQPDVLLCQEFRNGKSAFPILHSCKQLELKHVHISKGGNSKNTVMIASRWPMHITAWYHGLDMDRAVQANISFDKAIAGLSTITLLAAHLPQKKKQVPYLDYLNEQTLESPTMIIGDLNCGIPFEDSERKSFVNTHLFQALLKKGWIDSWRSRNGAAKEFSWVSARGNAYRYDHCLSTSQLDGAIKTIEYQHAVRESGLSDHSALLVELG